MNEYLVSAEDSKKYLNIRSYEAGRIREEIFKDCPHVGKTGENIATPYELCCEIIDQLPDLNNKSILVLFNPELYLAIIDKYPFANIVFLTGSKVAASGLWSNAAVYYMNPHDVGSLGGNVKFDVVIGNPPYQNSQGKKAKRWVLWHRFIEKSIELVKNGGYVALITPSSWLAPSRIFDIMTSKQLINVDLTVGRYFDVGSTFSSFILQNIPLTKDTTIITDCGKLKISLLNSNFIPPIINKISLSINEKIFGKTKKMNFIRTTEYHSSSKKHLFTNEGEIEIFHTNSINFKTNSSHPNNSKHRVAITLSGYAIPKYIHNAGCSEIAIWQEVKNKDEADILINILNSSLFKYILSSNKWSGWNERKVFTALPLMDLSHRWTDKEIYKYFGLEQGEIDYVEKTIATGKKDKTTNS